MPRYRGTFMLAGVALLVAGAAGAAPPEPAGAFSFAVAGDMRSFADPDHHDSAYFLGALEAMRATGPLAFMIVPGDLDPPNFVLEDAKITLGSGFPVYPAIGNHDAAGTAFMTTIRALNAGGTALPNVVRKGPPGCEETTYAFEWGKAHFAVLNQYCDGRTDTGAKGDVTDGTFAWLAADLAATTKPFIFVIGHAPAFPLPDMTTGRVRHAGDSLNRNPAHRDRFWELLKERRVTAYLCGHTHNASARKIDGVWQLDSGHARGKGDQGSPSTFLKITVGDGECCYEFYRADATGRNYTVTRAGTLVND